jgi:endonuclease G
MFKSRGIPAIISILALLLVLFGLYWWFNRNNAPTPIQLSKAPTGPEVNLLLGNPSQAQPDPRTSGNNYLILRPQYALSYNNAKRIPNWSSWQLNRSWIGQAPRQNSFRPDPTLPDNWYRVKPSDYSGSGYDRGHITPSADRDNTPENQTSTYIMTNIVPQAPDNNQGPWVMLENYCRDLAMQGKELYIVAGSYGNKGVLQKGNITIPETVWKVIVVMDRPGQTPQDITAKTRVIAVEMPNSQGIRAKTWQSFQVSVDSLEARTGYDFLSRVVPEVQTMIEQRVNVN